MSNNHEGGWVTSSSAPSAASASSKFSAAAAIQQQHPQQNAAVLPTTMHQQHMNSASGGLQHQQQAPGVAPTAATSGTAASAHPSSHPQQQQHHSQAHGGALAAPRYGGPTDGVVRANNNDHPQSAPRGNSRVINAAGGGTELNGHTAAGSRPASGGPSGQGQGVRYQPPASAAGATATPRVPQNGGGGAALHLGGVTVGSPLRADALEFSPSQTTSASLPANPGNSDASNMRLSHIHHPTGGGGAGGSAGPSGADIGGHVRRGAPTLNATGTASGTGGLGAGLKLNPHAPEFIPGAGAGAAPGGDPRNARFYGVPQYTPQGGGPGSAGPSMNRSSAPHFIPSPMPPPHGSMHPYAPPPGGAGGGTSMLYPQQHPSSASSQQQHRTPPSQHGLPPVTDPTSSSQLTPSTLPPPFHYSQPSGAPGPAGRGRGGSAAGMHPHHPSGMHTTGPSIDHMRGEGTAAAVGEQKFSHPAAGPARGSGAMMRGGKSSRGGWSGASTGSGAPVASIGRGTGRLPPPSELNKSQQPSSTPITTTPGAPTRGPRGGAAIGSSGSVEVSVGASQPGAVRGDSSSSASSSGAMHPARGGRGGGRGGRQQTDGGRRADAAAAAGVPAPPYPPHQSMDGEPRPGDGHTQQAIPSEPYVPPPAAAGAAAGVWHPPGANRRRGSGGAGQQQAPTGGNHHRQPHQGGSRPLAATSNTGGSSAMRPAAECYASSSGGPATAMYPNQAAAAGAALGPPPHHQQPGSASSVTSTDPTSEPAAILFGQWRPDAVPAFQTPVAPGGATEKSAASTTAGPPGTGPAVPVASKQHPSVTPIVTPPTAAPQPAAANAAKLSEATASVPQAPAGGRSAASAAAVEISSHAQIDHPRTAVGKRQLTGEAAGTVQTSGPQQQSHAQFAQQPKASSATQQAIGPRSAAAKVASVSGPATPGQPAAGKGPQQPTAASVVLAATTGAGRGTQTATQQPQTSGAPLPARQSRPSTTTTATSASPVAPPQTAAAVAKISENAAHRHPTSSGTSSDLPATAPSGVTPGPSTAPGGGAVKTTYSTALAASSSGSYLAAARTAEKAAPTAPSASSAAKQHPVGPGGGPSGASPTSAAQTPSGGAGGQVSPTPVVGTKQQATAQGGQTVMPSSSSSHHHHQPHRHGGAGPHPGGRGRGDKGGARGTRPAGQQPTPFSSTAIPTDTDIESQGRTVVTATTTASATASGSSAGALVKQQQEGNATSGALTVVAGHPEKASTHLPAAPSATAAGDKGGAVPSVATSTSAANPSRPTFATMLINSKAAPQVQETTAPPSTGTSSAAQSSKAVASPDKENKASPAEVGGASAATSNATGGETVEGSEAGLGHVSGREPQLRQNGRGGGRGGGAKAQGRGAGRGARQQHRSNEFNNNNNNNGLNQQSDTKWSRSSANGNSKNGNFRDANNNSHGNNSQLPQGGRRNSAGHAATAQDGDKSSRGHSQQKHSTGTARTPAPAALAAVATPASTAVTVVAGAQPPAPLSASATPSGTLSWAQRISSGQPLKSASVANLPSIASAPMAAPPSTSASTTTAAQSAASAGAAGAAAWRPVQPQTTTTAAATTTITPQTATPAATPAVATADAVGTAGAGAAVTVAASVGKWNHPPPTKASAPAAAESAAVASVAPRPVAVQSARSIMPESTPAMKPASEISTGGLQAAGQQGTTPGAAALGGQARPAVQAVAARRDSLSDASYQQATKTSKTEQSSSADTKAPPQAEAQVAAEGVAPPRTVVAPAVSKVAAETEAPKAAAEKPAPVVPVATKSPTVPITPALTTPKPAESAEQLAFRNQWLSSETQPKVKVSSGVASPAVPLDDAEAAVPKRTPQSSSTGRYLPPAARAAAAAAAAAEEQGTTTDSDAPATVNVTEPTSTIASTNAATGAPTAVKESVTTIRPLPPAGAASAGGKTADALPPPLTTSGDVVAAEVTTAATSRVGDHAPIASQPQESLLAQTAPTQTASSGDQSVPSPAPPMGLLPSSASGGISIARLPPKNASPIITSPADSAAVTRGTGPRHYATSALGPLPTSYTSPLAECATGPLSAASVGSAVAGARAYSLAQMLAYRRTERVLAGLPHLPQMIPDAFRIDSSARHQQRSAFQHMDSAGTSNADGWRTDSRSDVWRGGFGSRRDGSDRRGGRAVSGRHSEWREDNRRDGGRGDGRMAGGVRGGSASELSFGGGGSSWRGAPAPKLESSENSWVVKQQEEKAKGDTSVIVIRKMRLLLNKLTVENFDRLYEQLKGGEPNMTTFEELEALVRLIFTKATEQHQYIAVYVVFCKLLNDDIQTFNIKDKDSDGIADFRRLLVNVCQDMFEVHTRSPEMPDEDLSEEEKFEFLLKFKHRVKGNMIFIGELAKASMLAWKVIHSCIQLLCQSNDEHALEGLCVLLDTVGPFMVMKSKKTAGNVFAEVERRSKDMNLHLRVRCLLMDCLDHYAIWLKGGSHKSKDGPMTISELHQRHGILPPTAHQGGPPMGSAASRDFGAASNSNTDEFQMVGRKRKPATAGPARSTTLPLNTRPTDATSRTTFGGAGQVAGRGQSPPRSTVIARSPPATNAFSVLASKAKRKKAPDSERISRQGTAEAEIAVTSTPPAPTTTSTSNSEVSKPPTGGVVDQDRRRDFVEKVKNIKDECISSEDINESIRSLEALKIEIGDLPYVISKAIGNILDLRSTQRPTAIKWLLAWPASQAMSPETFVTGLTEFVTKDYHDYLCDNPSLPKILRDEVFSPGRAGLPEIFTEALVEALEEKMSAPPSFDDDMDDFEGPAN